MSNSRLSLHLGNLIEWLREVGPVADLREIRIFEERSNRAQKAPVRIPKSLLHSPSDYENRFDQLFEKGRGTLADSGVYKSFTPRARP